MGERGRGLGFGRRGLLAGAAALVAGGLAKLAGPERVEAGHTSLLNPEPLHIGVINDGTNATNVETATSITAETVLVANGGSAAFRGRQLGATLSSFGVEGISGYTGVHGQSVGNTNGTSGVFGESNVIGVRGFSVATYAQSVGVLGFLTRAGTPFPSYNTPAGVLGVTLSGVSGAGVAGVATTTGTGNTVSNVGVHGQSTTGTGVRGDSASGTAIYGESDSRIGVHGRSDSYVGVFADAPNSIGLYAAGNGAAGAFGTSQGGYGVWGLSTNNSGVYGESTNFAGVQGRSTNHYGVFATSPLFAGVFQGSVYVTGNFTVVGGAKSAAVKRSDGSLARVYCQESPEPWFEDFGEAELKGGRAVVTLDPEFDDVVKGDAYQVFLSAYGDLGVLYVEERRPHRFVVRSERGPSASGTIGYRVVARRKEDVGRRLETVNAPDLTNVKAAPKAPDAPKPPDQPKPSTLPRAADSAAGSAR